MSFIPPPNDSIIAAFAGLTALAEVDRGGFKVVYRATVGANTEMFKLVCLPVNGKTDEERQAYRNESLGRIRREIQLLGKCQSSELVKLGSIEPQLTVIGGQEYVGYSEEFLPGDNLGKLIRNRGHKPSEQQAKRLMLTLLKAIQELWGTHRTVHRDIKPANVMKLPDPDRPFVLLDLGIAYGLLETGLTHDGGAPCTPRYLAPEMARPDFRRDLDYRSDLYTTALTVFEYSAQMHPLAKTRDDLIQTISRALYQAPRRFRDERPDFSESFCDLVDQMLKKKPQLRPSDLHALIAEMEAPV